MNEIMNFEGYNVEVIEVEGKVLFNAKNVGEVLDMSDVTVRRHIQGMTDRQVVKLKNSNVQDMNFRKLHNTGENFLTEAGVYKLAFRSNKPSAEKFTNWVAEEVLPKIRKTGSYSMVSNEEEYKKELAYQLLVGGIDSIEAHKKLLEIETKPLIETIEKQQPKVDYANKVLESNSTYNITQIAKDYGLSARSLNSVLHDLGIQYKSGNQWVLYSKYQDKGYTESYTDTNDNGYAFTTTKWTQKGRMFLYEILKANGYIPVKELN